MIHRVTVIGIEFHRVKAKKNMIKAQQKGLENICKMSAP